MNDQLLESLLYRSEDPSVDFKAEQYVMSKLDPAKYPSIPNSQLAELFKEKKSELLKDVLAMSNAWRDDAAYILIGFKENKPNRPILVGISEQDYYDDAVFQQFIASKVNKTLEFQYEIYPYKGKAVGVLTIPKQCRPFFATETFGRVKARTVYVRRGSSTLEADPTEVASMGAAELERQQEARVEIGLENSSRSDLTLQPQKIDVVDFGDISKLPDYYEESSGPFAMNFDAMRGRINSDYWRELATWTKAALGLLAVHFSLVNLSQFALSDCKLEVEVTHEEGNEPPMLETKRSLPPAPTRTNDLTSIALQSLETQGKKAYSVKIRGKPGAQVCEIRVAKILAGETVTVSDEFLAVLPTRGGKLFFRMRLLAHEIPQPIAFERTVEIEAIRQSKSMDDLERIADAPKS